MGFAIHMSDFNTHILNTVLRPRGLSNKISVEMAGWVSILQLNSVKSLKNFYHYVFLLP